MRATAFTLCCCLLWSAVPAAGSVDGAKSGDSGPPRLVVGPGDEIRPRPATGTAAVEVEAAFDGGPLLPVPDRLTAPDEGTHWLAVAGRDAAGNLSPVRWIEVVVDGRPPAVELTTRPEAAIDEAGRRWLPAGAETLARATDDPAGVEGVTIEVDGEVREAGGPEISARLPDAGVAVVRAWAVDRVANRSSAETLTLRIDGAPPTVSIRASAPWQPGEGGGVDGALLSPTSRLGVEIEDPDSGGVEWTPAIDGEPVPREALRAPLEPGEHTVEVAATDRVGNERRVGPLRFTVDGEGPRISWRVTTSGVTGGDGESYYRSPVEVLAEAHDEVAGLFELRASLDGRDFEPVEGPITVDGDSLHLHAFDRVANATRVTASWNLDHQAPEVEIVTPGGEAVPAGGRLTVERGAELEVRAVDRGAGIARSSYVMNRRLPPGERRPRPLPERLRCDRTGRFYLKIEAEDHLGNSFSGRWTVEVRRDRGTAGEEVSR